MVMVVLTSAAGAPGVTTTALGWALAWPRPAVLVDVDRDPSQAVLAGYLGGADPQGRGLASLAQAHRENRPLDVLGACLPLPPHHHQAYLPGFANPGQVSLFTPVWPALAHALAVIASGQRDVLVDAGRVGSSGLPLPLVQAADAVLLVVRSSLRSLAGVRHHVSQLAEQVGTEAVGLVMVGPGQPYSPAEVTAQFRVPVVATLPWDPHHAAVLSDGAPARPRRGQLSRGLEQSAEAVLRRYEQRRAEVRGAA